MAWPNPFYRRTPNTRTAWQYTFEFGPDHLTPEECEPLKQSYDVLGEECLNVLNEFYPAETVVKTENANEKPVKPKRDLYLLLRNHRSEHPKLQELWDEVTTIPEWVDWDQIARGQEVFYRYGGATLTGLAHQSLLGGMGANRVVEVLARTGGFTVNVARHRLFETTQHILECTRTLDGIKPLGEGFASSLRVRLLHASVRNRIMKLAQSRPEYYSVEKFGVPINDLDCIGTIGTFSATIVWLALPRQGIWLRKQEIEDYMALWRLIAHYMGTPTEYFATTKRAKAVMEAITYYEMNPSKTSRLLANNLLKCLENQPPAYVSRPFLEAQARWLNGSELCDALGIGRPSWYYTALMAGQCMFFCALCYTYRSFEVLDKRKIKALREVFWNVIVESKFGLKGEKVVFEFKHVPSFQTVTYKGEEEELSDEFKGESVERRNLKALVIGVVGLGVAGFLGWKVSSLLLRAALGAGGYAARNISGLLRG